ncbi:hypothetical protein [Streptomyces katrae]|uniref:hypothetical protein n=1 Tax=Streptomyces katrae TaxID=68223 RepID=UPI0004BF29E9|nr:hypothetical protein [Streptomyces katrae]
MKILGFCDEFWSAKAGESKASVRDLVRESGEADESALLEYLDGGYEILSFMGSVNDVLGSDERILGGDNILTDGEWVWRGDLWFYVATYHLSLPDEFLQQVRSHRYVMPEVSREDRLAVYEEVRRIL